MDLKDLPISKISTEGFRKDYNLSTQLIELLSKGTKDFDNPEPRHDIEDLEDDNIDHWDINSEDPENEAPAGTVPATIWYDDAEENWEPHTWMVIMWRCPKTKSQRMTGLISDGHCYMYSVRIIQKGIKMSKKRQKRNENAFRKTVGMELLRKRKAARRRAALEMEKEALHANS